MTDERIRPTDEDLDITQRNIRRLQRWLREAGHSDHGRRAVDVARNFALDMMHFGPAPIRESGTRPTGDLGACPHGTGSTAPVGRDVVHEANPDEDGSPLTRSNPFGERP